MKNIQELLNKNDKQAIIELKKAYPEAWPALMTIFGELFDNRLFDMLEEEARK